MINKTTILAITLAFTTAACSTEKKGGTDITTNTQNKTMTAEEVAAKGFERIEIKGSFDVHFTIGNKTSIRLKGKSEEIARTKLESDGQTLRISVKNDKRKRFLNMGCDVDIYITSPLLTAVKIKGASDFDSQNEIKAETFSANISGSGDMKINSLTANSVKTRISGSGDMEFGNIESNSINSKISGSGDLKMKRIKTEALKTSIAGSGDMEFDNADINNADISIAGSGDVKIKGRIGSYNRHVTGSGTVKIEQQSNNKP